jgi:hypothetical protein
MLSKFDRSFLLICLLIIIINQISCKKEDEYTPPDKGYYNPGPLLYSNDYIIGEVNAQVIEGKYKYGKDTLSWTYYSSIQKQFNITRFTNPESKYWGIIGKNINLSMLSFPVTYNSLTTFNSTLESRIAFVYSEDNRAFTQSRFDSTLFSITLNGYSNDSLYGVFSGTLILLDNFNKPDSVRQITNGSFFIHLYDN